MANASTITRNALEPQIRTARPADRAALLELHRHSLRTLGRGFYSDAEIESFLRHAPTLEDYLLADGTYFVAWVGGRMAGCGGWSLRIPGYSLVTGQAMPPAGTMPRLRAMFVHPQFARCGIGRYLLADIERSIWDSGHQEIRVDATLGGVPLYERCGYRPFGQTLAVLPDGCRMRFVNLHKRIQ